MDGRMMIFIRRNDLDNARRSHLRKAKEEGPSSLPREQRLKGGMHSERLEGTAQGERKYYDTIRHMVRLRKDNG